MRKNPEDNENIEARADHQAEPTDDAKSQELLEAEAEQEELVSKLNDKIHEQKEPEVVEDDTQKQLLKWVKYSAYGIGLTFAFVLGGMVFKTTPASQSTLVKVANLVKTGHDNVMALSQNLSDDMSALTVQLDAIKKGQLHLNTGMQSLGTNQQNIIDAVNHQKSPDLSKIQTSLDAIKSQLKAQRSVSTKHSATLTSGNEASHQVSISYEATSPNGAILKVMDGSDSHYITVTPATRTDYGDVTFVSNKEVKIAGKTVRFNATEPTKISVGGK